MLGRADLLIMGGVPDALSQQQQARLIGFSQLRAHLVQPRRQVPGFAFIKLPPLPAHRAGNTQQHHQFLAQAANGSGSLTPTITFEPGMFALAVDGDDAPKAFQQPFTRLILPPQHGAGRLQAIVPSLPGLTTQLLFHAHRPDQGTGGGGAEDPQANLGAAGHGLVEHLKRVIDRGQGDDRSGVAGQHKGVGPGAAQLGRGRRAQCQP
ncbi:hypothetical protein D3C81_1217090 [compost metagenome]